MSSLLYALGRWASRARFLVLGIWVTILALLGAGALLFSQGATASITIPGTESQAAIDTLGHTFPEVSGSSARIIVVTPEGLDVTQDPFRDAIIDVTTDLEDLDSVSGVSSPFSELAATGLSENGRAALITIQVQTSVGEVPEALEQGIISATETLQNDLPAGTQVSYGGDIFSTSTVGNPAE